jgi:hypothetical protein
VITLSALKKLKTVVLICLSLILSLLILLLEVYDLLLEID